MKVGGSRDVFSSTALGRAGFPRTFLIAWAVIISTVSSPAGTGINFEDPTRFFTDVASRLLRDELNLDLARVQVYPANQYTPAVHRLLQVTANLYDAATNRPSTGYPYLPSVFRPLFRRDGAGMIFIAAYREVTDARMAEAGSAPAMVDLQDSAGRVTIPPAGTAFDPDDQGEPMVYGVPLVIGAKKGFPNFNELAMQTAVSVVRRLEFRRGTPGGPIVETNQMYIFTVSSLSGVEAWNSYNSAFARDLRMTVAADLTMVLTNEVGWIVSNGVSFFASTNIPASTWTGFTNEYSPRTCFQVALSNSASLLAPSTWRLDQAPGFVPVTNAFDRDAGFPIPRWWLGLAVRLRFILVDVSVTPNRIVDYVNLDGAEDRLDIPAKLVEWFGQCATYDPSGNGNQWCTNRVNSSPDIRVPTYGILNQIWSGRSGNTGVTAIKDSAYTGKTLEYSVDFFRAQFGLGPIYTPGPYSKSNIFYAPLDPAASLYIRTAWQANDPLVHFTLADLIDPKLEASKVTFQGEPIPLSNLGRLNSHYEPWSGNPLYSGNSSTTKFDASVKDPLVACSDDWNFPSGLPPTPAMLGQVHRGTPWQTIYLKSASASIADWSAWSGITSSYDAQHTLPTNDWRLVSLLATLLNTNDVSRRLFVNDPDPGHWLRVLDGLSVLTNTVPDARIGSFSTPQFDSLVMSSNSPQAQLLAQSIGLAHSTGTGIFRNIGDIFALPELSVASPWLNRSDVQLKWGISDAAYEIVPAQLLSLLRADSFGRATWTENQLVIEFSGYDGCQYGVEASSNLRDWLRVSTNCPVNGAFSLTNAAPGNTSLFYRSVLLP